VLVDAFADRWEVVDRDPPGKTVRAEVDLPPSRLSAGVQRVWNHHADAR
jgi:hypothetical protein